MMKHRKLLERLTQPCRKVTDGNNIAWLPDPATWKSDGFSSGVKSMEPHVFKVYMSPTSWDCSHELFRLVPTYGQFEHSGKVLERGKTGAGLWNSFVYAFSSKAFPDSDIPHLGLSTFKRNVIKYVLDNGSGNLSVSKQVERTKSLQTYVEDFDEGANVE